MPTTFFPPGYTGVPGPNNTNLGGDINSIKSAVNSTVNTGQKSITTAVDPSAARLAVAGLTPGGLTTSKVPTGTADVKFADDVNDWRVRVSIDPDAKILYKDPADPGVLKPLLVTNGVIFPYVPSVTTTHRANYSPVQLTHTNYANYFYESSAVESINISADFTVQNREEAAYFLAAIYFFRACTKMFFGASAQYSGSPPPIVYLDGYGTHYLPHVPCVVTSFMHTMPADVDYMEVVVEKSGEVVTQATNSTGTSINLAGVSPSVGNNQKAVSQTTNYYPTRVPTASTISLSMQPVYSRDLQSSFDYSAFARGDMINGDFGGLI